jgi:hypothetical protein
MVTSDSWAQQEWAGAQVWDGRARQSLIRIGAAVERHHGLSFSAACGPALRQAGHRLFAHATTTVTGLLYGHVRQTVRRAAGGDELILVAHDTTLLEYHGHRATTGLGPVSYDPEGRGLLAHAALALTPTGVPLGLVHLALWARDPATYGKKHTRQSRPTAAKESQKWLDALGAVEAAFPPDQPLLLLADREADLYDYLAAPRRTQTHLLVRACQPRRVTVGATGSEPTAAAAVPPEPVSLLVAAAQAPLWGRHVCAVPRRPGQAARAATLELRVVTVQLCVPRDRRRQPGGGRDPAAPPVVTVLAAREVDAPPGTKKPLHWVLITTLPITDLAAAVQVLTYYTRRWEIERLHYTLKSGLQIERLQFDDATSLQHAAAVYYVVAWRLLWLTHRARAAPDEPPGDLVDAAEQQVLAAATGGPIRTRREAVRAIARLGGFPGHPAAGEPGVKSLWLGLTRLAAMAEGWRLAQAQNH